MDQRMKREIKTGINLDNSGIFKLIEIETLQI